MPVIQREVSVPANGTIENLYSGSAFEFLRGNSVISIGVAAAATGIVMNIQSGADIVLEEATAPILTRYPIIPDEMYYTDVGQQGDRVVTRVRNTTGAAIIVRTICQITQL
jgi:hypothetical protein